MITPEYIDKLINFYPGAVSSQWKYDINATDMRNLQIKGAARIYNLLEKQKLALLADEVGMGKTIQSLAVISALLHKKPDAKILILAPRDEVARNWLSEYQNFISYHYRHNDDVVKCAIGNEPVRKMIYCTNLFELAHEIKQGWGQIFVGKISSFSSLLSKKEIIHRLEEIGIRSLAKLISIPESQKENRNNEIARLIRNEVMKYAEPENPFFDLVIIDEAHYFRNKDGGSLRVNSAEVFFGKPGSIFKPITQKVLLLTATPNHSSSNDIGSIVSYFTDKFEGNDYKKILDTICIRRLRRLGKNSYNKYNYRNEIASQSNFKDNPLSEMFFGLYHHELARTIHQARAKGMSVKGVTRIMKYLEGVEFISPPNSVQDTANLKDKSVKSDTDFMLGEDARILSELSEKYNAIFHSNPKHPKYDKLVDDLTIKNNGEKAVVFVRRINSVKEITKRVLEFYDQKFWNELRPKMQINLPFKSLNRKSFKRAISSNDQEEVLDNDDLIKSEVKESDIPNSVVLNLFKVIKNDAVVRTDASNFRMKFNHSKPSVFSLFFSPGSDHFGKPYIDFVSYRYEVGDEELENFFNSALICRTENIENKAIGKDIRSELSKNSIKDSGEIKADKIDTLMTVFWEILVNDSDLSEEYKASLIKTYNEFNYYEKESFSNFLEKGTLLASESVIWLYTIFIDARMKHDDKPLLQYQYMIEKVKTSLKNQRLFIQIQESILHFKTIYSKVFSIKSNKDLLRWEWDNFNNALPVYPYNADNKNKNMRDSFNTPFYPDFLVSTSVLQEGVNLQYFCKTIYHYGMAWTPGDNEQRIGRVDRLFGKIERDLNANDDSMLPIYYPYLKDTVDEQHLARFAKRKYKEEMLIDLGMAFPENSNFMFEENDNDNWRDFLRTPTFDPIEDPYQAKIKDFEGLKTPQLKINTVSFIEYLNSIKNAIQELNQYAPESYFVDNSNNLKLIIDPNLDKTRKQPVVVEIIFDPIGTGYFGRPVYCVKMKTPLAATSKFKNFKDVFYSKKIIQENYRPGLKLCLDISQTSGSLWGIYMSYELPLFITEIFENPLSAEEIQESFKSLIYCADLTEKIIFEQQDINLDALNMDVSRPSVSNKITFRRASKQNVNSNWRLNNNFYILEKECFLGTSDVVRQSLIENHNNLYIKAVLKNTKWVYQAAYHALDACKEELDVIEKHLNVVCNKIR